MLAAGTRLGPFAITSLLGVGGMGEVYRARDERLGRDVAIKVLPAVVGLDPERRARFQREARVLANLNHPNIAAIHGLEEHDGFFALILEFVDGDTLADVVARGPLPPTAVARIAHQLVDALDAAHERGIVHRDLKPANVKLTPNDTIKVLDFGLAKAVEGSAAATDPMMSPTVTSGGTRDGVIMGTAAYMSPEQARGRPVDKRADIWAFGCVLYELLTGERPFPGESVSDVIVAVLQREPRWEALPASTPRGMVSLLRHCLEKDTRTRLRDIADAREYLQRSDAADPIAATTRARGSWPLIVAAAFGAALALTGAQFWPKASSIDAPSFDKVVRIVATAAHEFGPAISPDGKWIAYLSDARGPTDVWVKFLSGGESANLTEKLDVVVQTQDYISGLQISPDGASIAFSSTTAAAALTNQQQSWIIPAPLGGQPRPALDAPNQGLTWSPDGRRIAYMRAGGSAGDALWVADADGGNAREILPATGGLHAHWLRWSADGRYIYFNRGWQNFNTGITEVYRVPSSGGQAEPVVQTLRRAVYPFPDASGRGLFYSANRDSPELSLWWRELASGRDIRVTTGIGEYGAPSVSADGTRVVATETTVRQQVMRLDLSQLPVTAPQPLSDPLSGDMDPAWSVDGNRVVFSSLRGGARNIWTARSDLTGATQLTVGDSIDERPTFSPDGREVAFVSDRGGRRGIWLVHAAGGTPRLLAETPIISNASWSRDGRRLVFSLPGPTAPTLAIVSHEDGRIAALPVTGAASAPVWSPRADVIAYLETRTGGTGVLCRTIDPEGRPVAAGFPVDPIQAANGFIAWSADGEHLVSVSMPGARRGSIWIIDKSGAEPRKVIDLAAATHVRGIGWAPDGKTLLAGFDARSGDIVLLQKVERK